MYLLSTEDKDWLVNIRCVLRPSILPIEQKVFLFRLPIDRGDNYKEFYQLPGG